MTFDNREVNKSCKTKTFVETCSLNEPYNCFVDDV